MLSFLTFQVLHVRLRLALKVVNSIIQSMNRVSTLTAACKVPVLSVAQLVCAVEAVEVPLASSFADEFDVGDDDVMADGFAHVVDRERGHRHSGQCLHLHTSPACGVAGSCHDDCFLQLIQIEGD